MPRLIKLFCMPYNIRYFYIADYKWTQNLWWCMLIYNKLKISINMRLIRFFSQQHPFISHINDFRYENVFASVSFNILVLKGYLIDKSILMWKRVRSAHFRINFLSFQFLDPCNTNWCRFDSLITLIIFSLSRIFGACVIGFQL